MSLFPRRCAQVGCPRLLPAGQSRCPEHQTGGWARYRPPWRDAYQTSAWRSRRADQLAREPRCRACGMPAIVADHVENVAGGGNFGGELQSLCSDCHRAKTLRESHQARKGTRRPR